MEGGAHPARAATPLGPAGPPREYPFPEDPPIACCAPTRVAIQPSAYKIHPARVLYDNHTIPVMSCFPPSRQAPAVVDVPASDDYEDRDPNRINQHIQVLWEDVVAEPDGVRSPAVWWRLSARLFRLTLDLVYTVLASALGPLVAVALGAGFAVIAFMYIWCVSPSLRVAKVCLSAAHSLLRSVAHAILVPITEALGFFFANVRVRLQHPVTSSVGPEGPPFPLMV